VRNSRALEHARQRFRDVDVDRSDEHRKLQLVKPLSFLEDGVVLLAPRLVDQVLTVVADYRPVGRNHRHAELVDLVELSLFGFRGTGHAGKLVVEAEVVLDRDGGERLGLAFHLYAFLRLDGLVQSLGPTATVHGAPGELIDDEHLTFLDHVVDVALEQRMCTQQLMHDVQPLALGRVVAIDRVARLELLGRSHVRVVIDYVDFLRQIGKNELVVGVGRHEVDAGVGEVHRVSLFVEHEQQIVLDVAVFLLAGGKPSIRNVRQLHFLHELLDAGLLKHLQQPLVLGAAELRLVEGESRCVVVPGLQCFLAGRDERIDEIGLAPHQSRHRRVVLGVLGVALVANRARDDQRRPRFVDQDRVHFVDDRVGVHALHPLVQRLDHVVAQVVEAVLVIRAVGDVALVSSAALHRPRLGIVNAADGEA